MSESTPAAAAVAAGGPAGVAGPARAEAGPGASSAYLHVGPLGPRRVAFGHVFERHVGATDDLRYAMALNPHMKVLISHGLYDLVTPYFATERLLGHLQLADALRVNLTTRHFAGGHMFYTSERSRTAFRETAASFVASAC